MSLTAVFMAREAVGTKTRHGGPGEEGIAGPRSRDLESSSGGMTKGQTA